MTQNTQSTNDDMTPADMDELAAMIAELTPEQVAQVSAVVNTLQKGDGVHPQPLTTDEVDEIIRQTDFGDHVEDHEFDEERGVHLYFLDDGRCVEVTVEEVEQVTTDETRHDVQPALDETTNDAAPTFSDAQLVALAAMKTLSDMERARLVALATTYTNVIDGRTEPRTKLSTAQKDALRLMADLAAVDAFEYEDLFDSATTFEWVFRQFVKAMTSTNE